MSLIVYTCVFGNTDPLHDPVIKGNARYVCFTDQDIGSSAWEIVKMPKQDAPTRAARLMKARSHVTFPDAEWSLWIDANFTLQVDPHSLRHHGDFVNFTHRDRQRITDESREIVRLGKAKADAIALQLATYSADGFDTDANPMRELSCNGVILRRHSPEVCALNEAWASEIETHTLRDQMSLDYCAWKHRLALSRWPGTHDANPYFLHKHFKRPTNDF